MNRGNPNYYVSGGYLSLKPASVIFAISSSPKEDVPSHNARRHHPDKEFTSHRSASPKSPELNPAISKESRFNNVSLSILGVLELKHLASPRVLKVKHLASPRVLKVKHLASPIVLEPTWDISQLPENQRLEIIEKRDEIIKKLKKKGIIISDLQAFSESSASNSSSGSSTLNPSMHQERDETKVSGREATQPHDPGTNVTGTLVYGTNLKPQELPPAGAGVLWRPEGAQVQKEKQSCFSGCIIS